MVQSLLIWLFGPQLWLVAVSVLVVFTISFAVIFCCVKVGAWLGLFDA